METSLTESTSVTVVRNSAFDGEFTAMTVNLTLLSMAVGKLNDTANPCSIQIREVEKWWGGIRHWKR